MHKPAATPDLTPSQLLDLYAHLLRPRLIEEKMLLLLRQGKISKWFSGIGQEAISVGVTSALQPDEFIFPLHRNLGVFTTRGMPLDRLFCQWQGKENGFTKGRDRSFHFGSMDYHIVGMISHLGPQLSLADGVGLAHKLAKEKKVAVTFTGDGGTSQGEFHEALNVAAVWNLPVIFIIENNGYGLSTPTNEQYACENLSDKGAGYGMQALTIDGNDFLEVYTTILHLAQELRENPRPVLVECLTFRMRGHEEASGTKYVPKKLLDEWAQKDPIPAYEKLLIERKAATKNHLETIKIEIKKEIDRSLATAYDQPEVQSTEVLELADVFAPCTTPPVPPDGERQNMRFVDALSDGLRCAMDRHPNLVLMGQDISEYGGVFKVTEGLADRYGKDRVRNTPLCESAIIGTALGLSIKGYKSMVEMQFADFVSCGFNQIVNNLAKLHYRWGQPADVVIRMPTGAGVGAGPFHSQSNEAWFTKTPGLKVVYPSNSFDAKGLLLSAFQDPNPVLYFEHKALYRSHSSSTPIGYYTVEIGKAKMARQGVRACIITYGMGVHWAIELVEKISVDVAVLDLRSLQPIDWEMVAECTQNTGKVLVLHEDTLTNGIGGEIASWIAENCFEFLDAPVVRVGSLDTPVPFAAELESLFLPVQRLQAKLEWLLNY